MQDILAVNHIIRRPNKDHRGGISSCSDENTINVKEQQNENKRSLEDNGIKWTQTYHGTTTMAKVL